MPDNYFLYNLLSIYWKQLENHEHVPSWKIWWISSAVHYVRVCRCFLFWLSSLFLSSFSFHLCICVSFNLEWQVLYTTELTKKNKKYHDGFLHIEPCGSFGKQVNFRLFTHATILFFTSSICHVCISFTLNLNPRMIFYRFYLVFWFLCALINSMSLMVKFLY